MSGTIQSIVFDPKHYHPIIAQKWLHEHGYHPIKEVHRTENQLRYRLSPPDFKRYTTKKLNRGISFVIGFRE